eukprot:2856332-Pyramimonas_sp.AAC.1
MVITGIGSQTSDESACRIHRSELGLILELGLPNYSYSSSYLERRCRFTHVTRAVGEQRTRTEENPEASGAFGCCIE